MTIVAELFDTVIGVDTHAATHTFVIVDAHTGAERHRARFATTATGVARAIAWIDPHTAGRTLLTRAIFGVFGAGGWVG